MARITDGLGKAREVPEAIRKGVESARRALVTVPMVGRTIPHPVFSHVGAGKVLMKPASKGTGVIAGGAMRAVLELAGVHDILTKSLGTNNPINVIQATVDGLRRLRTADEVAKQRGKTVAELFGKEVVDATAAQAPSADAAPAAEGIDESVAS